MTHTQTAATIWPEQPPQLEIPPSDSSGALLGLTSEVISTDRACERTYDALSGIIARLEKEAQEAWCEGIGSGAWQKADGLEKKARAYRRRRDAMLRCTIGDSCAWVFRCVGCAERKIGQPMGCNARWCPKCCKKLRESNIAHVLDILKCVDERRLRDGAPAPRWRFVTLTIRSQPCLLRMRQDIAKAWGKLIRRRWWIENVGACVAAFEITHTAAGWHVHIHALVDAFIPREWLVRVWEQVTGGEGLAQGQHVSEPRGSRDQIARELSKYVGKDLGGHFAENPGPFGVAGSSERLQEFISATERWRALRTYGDAYYAAEISQACGVLCDHCKMPMEYELTVWMSPTELLAARRAQRARLRAQDPATSAQMVTA